MKATVTLQSVIESLTLTEGRKAAFVETDRLSRNRLGITKEQQPIDSSISES